MGELQPQTSLHEYTLNQRTDDIVEHLLAQSPRIIGLGVYIWNAEQTLSVVRLIKTVKPDITIIVGGPEISYETTAQELFKWADHVITGQADTAFGQTCDEVLTGQTPAKLISPLPLKLDQLATPYPFYTAEDLAQRVLYVEASRGCPFKCEFCLSSLDKTATAYPLDAFLLDMQALIDRGARHFKFVDRTFNLKADTSRQILEFFLQHIDKGLFLHFELIPDRLPDILKTLIPKFPAGVLQFEIGIQSFNPDVQKLISRKQQHEKTCENIQWIRNSSQAHIHADLIFGLPGENLESFARGFNELYALGPHEIQVGILKRLRGTPIARHTEQYDMRYDQAPPYRVLSTSDVSFDTMQAMTRFARYWDLLANSGRFPNTLPMLLGTQPFDRFWTSSEWIFNTTKQTHKIALNRWFTVLYQLLTDVFLVQDSDVIAVLEADYAHNRLKGRPKFVSLSEAHANNNIPVALMQSNDASKRQQRHS